VVWQGVTLAGIGIALGLLGGLGLAFAIASMLFGVEPTDPATYAGVAVTLLSVAVLAGYIPVRRALGQNPIQALRQ
jgi:putative ABC transport system permease protein